MSSPVTAESDWQRFAAEIPWALGDQTPDALRDAGDLGAPEPALAETFPRLAELLGRARRCYVKSQLGENLLYTWDKADGSQCGWFSLLPAAPPAYVHPDHATLLTSFGGVLEIWDPPPSHLSGIDGAFGLDVTGEGFSEWQDFYEHVCVDEGATPIKDGDDLVTFARWRSGDIALVHRETGELRIFAPRRPPAGATSLPGQPPHTFYRLDGAPTFRDFAEGLASVWLATLE